MIARQCPPEFYNETSSLNIFDMSITQHQTICSGQMFLLSHLASLLTFAAQNAQFAHGFMVAIRSQKWSASVGEIPLHSSDYLLPTSIEDAVTTAQWAMHTLQTHPEYSIARSTLLTWAQHYESPKDLVLGIVGLAIIGPTLGIISTKKKKKRKSQLIIEKSYFATLNKTELAILSTQLTQSVIAQETKLAGGNVYNLHPDSAAWCVEEALTQVYTDSLSNLNALLQTAVSDNLSHCAENDAQGNLQALVISPSVNDSLVEESTAEKI